MQRIQLTSGKVAHLTIAEGFNGYTECELPWSVNTPYCRHDAILTSNHPLYNHLCKNCLTKSPVIVIGIIKTEEVFPYRVRLTRYGLTTIMATLHRTEVGARQELYNLTRMFAELNLPVITTHE